MSAETLTLAATEMRKDARAMDDQSAEFLRAVADWLVHIHANVSTYSAMNHTHPFVVARAYLGESS